MVDSERRASSSVGSTARIWKGEDGFLVVQREELPGVITQGKVA